MVLKRIEKNHITGHKTTSSFLTGSCTFCDNYIGEASSRLGVFQGFYCSSLCTILLVVMGLGLRLLDLIPPLRASHCVFIIFNCCLLFGLWCFVASFKHCALAKHVDISVHMNSLVIFYFKIMSPNIIKLRNYVNNIVYNIHTPKPLKLQIQNLKLWMNFNYPMWKVSSKTFTFQYEEGPSFRFMSWGAQTSDHILSNLVTHYPIKIWCLETMYK